MILYFMKLDGEYMNIMGVMKWEHIYKYSMLMISLNCCFFFFIKYKLIKKYGLPMDNWF